MPEFRAVYYGSTLVDQTWSSQATSEYISRVRKQSNRPVKVRLVVGADGIQVIDRETGDVIQNSPINSVAHNLAGNQQFIYTTVSRAGMMYCHVLAVKENAGEIPVCISRALGPGSASTSSPRPSVGNGNFSIDSAAAGSPPPPPPARAASTRASPAARPSLDAMMGMGMGVSSPPPGMVPTKSIKRTQGMLTSHSSLSAVSSPSQTPPTQRSQSVDNGDVRAWSLKFDALYLGAEAVPSADMDGIRAGMRHSEEHRKAIDALRRQMGSKKAFEGDPVVLVVTGTAVRIEERVTGETLQTDFIKMISFTGTLPNGQHELFAYICSDSRLGRINCYLFNIDPGKSKEISRAITSALERQIEDERKAKAANPFAVTDPAREAAPPALFARQIHRADLTAIDCIGSGQFGSVYIAHQKVPMGRGDGGGTIRSRAVKLLRNAATPEDKAQFIHEAEVMLQMNHPNVVRMIGVAIQQKPWLCVLEFLYYGDLRGALLGCKEKSIVLEVPEMLYFAQQLSSGCGYIASIGFVHMDLACRNCMLTEKNIVKVGDFGLTKPFMPGKDYFLLGADARLPVRWVALEGFTHKMFSEKSDVWSLAITIWEIFTYGELPYKKHRTQDVPRRVYEGERLEIPPGCPDSLWPTLLRCWDKNPAERPTFVELTDAISQYLEGHMPVRDIGALLQTSRRKASMSLPSGAAPRPQQQQPPVRPAAIPEDKMATLQKKAPAAVLPQRCPVCNLQLLDKMSSASAQIHLQTCENARMEMGSSPTPAAENGKEETKDEFGFGDDEPATPAPAPAPAPAPVVVTSSPPPPTASAAVRGKQGDEEDEMHIDEEMFQPAPADTAPAVPAPAPVVTALAPAPAPAPAPSPVPVRATPAPAPAPVVAVSAPAPAAQEEPEVEEDYPLTSAPTLAPAPAPSPAPVRAAPAAAAAPVAAPAPLLSTTALAPQALQEAKERSKDLEVSDRTAAMLKVRQSNAMFSDGANKKSRIFEALNPQRLAFQTAKDRAETEESEKIDLGRLGARDGGGGGGGGGGAFGFDEDDGMDMLMSADAAIAAAQERAAEEAAQSEDEEPEPVGRLDPNNLPEFDDEMRAYMKAMREKRARDEQDKRDRLKRAWEEKKRKEMEEMDRLLEEIRLKEEAEAKKRETNKDDFVAEAQKRIAAELDFSSFRFAF